MATQPETATLKTPEFHWPPPPRTKWEREHCAFQRLLPQLLLTRRGQFVAIHEEQVVDSDRDEIALIGRVLALVGNVDIHVGLVTDQPEPIYRSGVVRDLSGPEAS
jgi:hypothetical protein